MNAVRPSLVVTLCAALLLSACHAHRRGPAAAAAAVAAPVTVLAPVATTVYEASPGTVVATNSARIASRLSGYVRALHVDVGDKVKAGELLLTIDNRDVEAQVAQARAAVSSARAAYADAEFNYTRYTNLYRQQAASRQEYEAVTRDYAAARAGVTAAAAGLARAEAQRAYAEVRAPFAGVVTARYVETGDLATPGAPLLEVQAPDRLEVRTQVSGAAYRALAPGAGVLVVAAGAHTEAAVLQLSPAADPATETHLLKAALPAAAGFGSGDFVRVLVAVGTRRALFVPAAAVVTRAGIPAVFVLDASNRAHLRMVRTGAARAGRIEILSGLSAGERIVAAPGDAVANGTPIAPARPQPGD